MVSTLTSLLTFLLVSLVVAAPNPGPGPDTASYAPFASLTHCRLDGLLPSPTPSDFHFSGNIRTYYIAAEEIDWDYAPSGWDNWLSVPVDKSPRADAGNYNGFSIGTKWRKAVYREYTDASFTQRSTQPVWQGLQGPTIRAEVGDLIEILFVNTLSTHYASMHSMGLAYSKDNEGSVYEFANETVRGDAVPPNGGCWVYKWVVPESAAPNDDEPATMHAYHSYVSIQEDLNAGLVGPQITYQRGEMDNTMARYHEFPLLLQGTDESKSMLAATNARREGRQVTVDYEDTFSDLRQYGNSTVWKPQITTLLSSLEFSDAPMFFAMNGYVLGNIPSFEMSVGDEVIWFVYGMLSHLCVFCHICVSWML